MDPTDLFSINGKRAIITGGTSGIGLAVAAHFVRAGATVVVTGRRGSGAELADGIGARFVRMDVADDGSVASAIEDAVELLGGLDILILNAGVLAPAGPLRELDLEAYRYVVDVNFHGVLRGMRFGLQHMGRGGVILVTSSPGGRQALAIPGVSAYGASKAAVDFLVNAAGLELAAEGIRVTGVMPGFIRTEIGGGGEAAAWLRHLNAAGEAHEPSTMGPVFHFLASDAARMLQGAVVAADDGCSAGLSSSVVGRLTAPASQP